MNTAKNAIPNEFVFLDSINSHLIASHVNVMYHKLIDWLNEGFYK